MNIKMSNEVSERYVGTINIINLLKWGWTKLFISKICDINRKILYRNNK